MPGSSSTVLRNRKAALRVGRFSAKWVISEQLIVQKSDKRLSLAEQTKRKERPSGAHPPGHNASLFRPFLGHPHSRLGLDQLRVAEDDVAALCCHPEIGLVKDPEVVGAADGHAAY